MKPRRNRMQGLVPHLSWIASSGSPTRTSGTSGRIRLTLSQSGASRVDRGGRELEMGNNCEEMNGKQRESET
jgi:hypothetical protein